MVGVRDQKSLGGMIDVPIGKPFKIEDIVALVFLMLRCSFV